MKESNEWGIAMEGCEEVITQAIRLAVNKMIRTEPLIYIEIGTGEGKTISQICKLFTNMNIDFKAIAIDLEDGWSLNVEDFIENVEEYGEKVELNLEGSPKALEEIKDETVFAVLIDGDHSFKNVIMDFNQADRIVKRGGLIMFHDSDEENQGTDAFERQPQGIEVREAIKTIGLLDGVNKTYEVLADHPGNKELNGRGIFIIRKK